jgi:hypothetical protein
MSGSRKRFVFIAVSIAVLMFFIVGSAFLKSFKNRSSVSIGETFQTAKGSEPATCPNPFIFLLPIDITKATSVLYPGQIRGGDFKAHGGFRFENSLPSDIQVTAPIDAMIIAGARYPVNTGDIQYTFDFENSCKIRYRLGHLLTLSPKFQEIANRFPMPEGLDSRTTQVYPPIEIKQGEVIATAVGMTKGGTSKNGTNTFLDWGVYDYRQKNEASKNPEWLASHSSEIYQYAVCWFNWITPEDKAKVLALPSSDGQSGKNSDYCK